MVSDVMRKNKVRGKEKKVSRVSRFENLNLLGRKILELRQEPDVDVALGNFVRYEFQSVFECHALLLDQIRDDQAWTS